MKYIHFHHKFIIVSLSRLVGKVCINKQYGKYVFQTISIISKVANSLACIFFILYFCRWDETFRDAYNYITIMFFITMCMVYMVWYGYGASSFKILGFYLQL